MRYLLVLNFPFLFLTSLFVGLGVFWVRPLPAGFYLAGLLVFTALHLLLRRSRDEAFKTRTGVLILIAGALIAAWVYRPLHLGTWDESSVMQALKLGALGVLTLLASHFGAQLPSGRHSLAASLAVLGLLWASALHYPLLPLLLVGLVQAVAIACVPTVTYEPQPLLENANLSRFTGLARYTVLLLATTSTATIWNYLLDTRWAVHLTVTFLAAALAALLGAGMPRRALLAAAVLAAAMVLSTTLAPGFALHPAHAAIAGLALGAVLAFLDRAGGPVLMIGASFYWVLGVLLSLAFARQLVYGPWRAVLLAPLVVFLFRLRPRSEART